uniref:RNA helicase n=1 Tax=Hirondellea gigas TaxID=1518452 RepID=A0A2P2I3K8_9CRUS
MLVDSWGGAASLNNALDDDQQVISYEEDHKSKHKAKMSKKSKLGGFNMMSFSKPVFEGIMRVGYKTPTPIQRTAIPVILSGQDVVAMARTGSGKTACFLLPMFEALKGHVAHTGPRALILEPTRELAEQTLRFAVKLGKFTGLHCALVVGGDSMDQQFGALHKHPDILIATPGRLMHVCVEMSLRLDSVQYVVFDEADRLFELGFREQLEETLSRLAPTRQTLLFSATLPQMLADFAKAGLTNPVMIRLDKDEKLSEHLKLAFFSIAPSFKLHLLLYILRHVVQSTEQVIVFVSTQLHVQYIEHVLGNLNLPCAGLYSAMDPTSRKINAAKFQKKIVNILVATDIAARGIDIPNLDYVINFNFPGTSRVFIHRVGRAARAGKSGVAISFVSSNEEAYMWDLHKFLGRSVTYSPKLESGALSKAIQLDMISGGCTKMTSTDCLNQNNTESNYESENNGGWNFQFGNVPNEIIAEESSQIDRFKTDCELRFLDEKKENAQKLYEKSRPRPSKEALREMKEMKQLLTPGDHPLLRASVHQCLHTAYKDVNNEMMERKMLLLEQLKNIRPKKTIFELGASGSKEACRIMKLKRKRDDPYILKCQEKLQEKRAKYQQLMQFKNKAVQLPEANEEDLYYDFPVTHHAKDEIQRAVDVKEKMDLERIEQEERVKQREIKKQDKLQAKMQKRKEDYEERQRKRQEHQDGNVKAGFFIPYQPADVHTEKGYNINDNFSRQSRSAQIELLEDSNQGLKRQKQVKKWDNKRNKFVGPKTTERKIKTESGRIIRGSYKTDRYEQWLKRNKIDDVSAEAAGGDELKQEQKEQAKNNKFQVISTRSEGKVHPLVRDVQKKLSEHGTQIVEEVRNKQQMKKHVKLQKRYLEDRERGKAMKRIQVRLQGGKPKTKKKGKKAKGK